MKRLDNLDYDSLITNLLSNGHISAHVLVGSRLGYNFVVSKLVDKLEGFEEVSIHRNTGAFRNIEIGSILSVSCYHDYDDVIQSTCGRVLDCIYIDHEPAAYTENYLSSRIRRPMSLPNIAGIAGITIFKGV